MEIIREKTEVELSFLRKVVGVNQTDFHWHGNYELCYLPEKPCDFWIDGEIVKAKRGDIVVIEEHIVHKFFAQSENTTVLVMQFQPRILLNADFGIPHLKKHITAEEIDKVPQLRQKFMSLLDIVSNEKSVAYTKDNLFLQSLFTALYFLLVRHFPLNKTDAASKKDRLDFYHIVEFVNKNYTEDINIKRISSELFMSTRRISSLFFKYTDTSPNDYIDLMRIKNANEMLDNGSNVTEAAFASGFQCIRTFNNVYKKHMKITPSEYIKKLGNGEKK
ncbi:MAG: AraC family transcriptional regulator [Clostridia bacterium]|nr:AraC family transcriptional regulator [Clostridia bacterium]